jgi:hypothetical protein
LPEDDIASLEVARRNASACQKSKINRRICHIRTPGSECPRGERYLCTKFIFFRFDRGESGRPTRPSPVSPPARYRD